MTVPELFRKSSWTDLDSVQWMKLLLGITFPSVYFSPFCCPICLSNFLCIFVFLSFSLSSFFCPLNWNLYLYPLGFWSVVATHVRASFIIAHTSLYASSLQTWSTPKSCAGLLNMSEFLFLHFLNWAVVASQCYVSFCLYMKTSHTCIHISTCIRISLPLRRSPNLPHILPI